VWCNENQQEALTAAKAGREVATASCENPIEETYKIGRDVGVRGTPTIIFDDGTVTPGYQPSAQLIERLGLNEG
jgi:thiol:disulfide interchange protein DsbC